MEEKRANRCTGYEEGGKGWEETVRDGGMFVKGSVGEERPMGDGDRRT